MKLGDPWYFPDEPLFFFAIKNFSITSGHSSSLSDAGATYDGKTGAEDDDETGVSDDGEAGVSDDGEAEASDNGGAFRRAIT